MRIRTRDKLVQLAEQQRQSGEQLYKMVGVLRAEGCSWRDIADAMGMDFRTLYYQYQRGASIVAIRDNRLTTHHAAI